MFLDIQRRKTSPKAVRERRTDKQDQLTAGSRPHAGPVGIAKYKEIAAMNPPSIARVLLVGLLALFAITPATSALAADGGRPFTATLTGAAEVPGPGDPDGSGTATLRFNPGLGE